MYMSINYDLVSFFVLLATVKEKLTFFLFENYIHIVLNHFSRVVTKSVSGVLRNFAVKIYLQFAVKLSKIIHVYTKFTAA
jgi:hypothetical protein